MPWLNAADWMHETWQTQGTKLRALLDDYAKLSG